MIRRSLAVLSAILMSVMISAGCASTTLTKDVSAESVSSKADEKQDQEEKNTDEKDKDEKNTDEAKPVETLSETTIYDANGISAVVNGISGDEDGKYIEVTVTNNSEKNITWSVDNIIVNDITTACASADDIEAGKTVKVKYPLKEALERYGITDIHIVQLISKCTDQATSETIDDCISEEMITNLGTEFDLSLPIDDWDLVYESDTMQIYYTGLIEEGDETDDYKTRANFMLFNDSESNISITPQEVSFDGVTEDGNNNSFYAQSCTYGRFFLTSKEDIAEKSEASFKLSIKDASTLVEDELIEITSVDLK